MKRNLMILCLLVSLVSGVSCGDKLQNAKTALAFISLGEATVANVFNTLGEAKKEECLKKAGQEGVKVFNDCYSEMAKALVIWEEIKPKLELALENAVKYIKAAESGKGGDYAQAVKQSVCLLTQLLPYIPGDEWKKKIQTYLNMAAAYACDNKPQTRLSQTKQLYLAKHLLQLLTDMGVQLHNG